MMRGLMLVLTAICCWLVLTPAVQAAVQDKHVLMITSYHLGDQWNDSSVQCVQGVLGPLAHVDLAIEHLDFRRHIGMEYEDRVTVAEDGQQVLDLFSAHHFDVILMDVQMPVLNGVEATREIRRLENENAGMLACWKAGNEKTGRNAGIPGQTERSEAVLVSAPPASQNSSIPVFQHSSIPEYQSSP